MLWEKYGMKGKSVKKRKNIDNGQVFGGTWALILILIFFFAFLPLLPSTARYRGDESYYINAAIRMVQTGDYFTPYYYDGAQRLNKPIFIYWTLAASYKIFGINLFSSRLPFLIAGCLVIWLSYKLSLLLFRRTEGAFIAAAITASNLTFFHVSVRSTTDILLCLFVSTSLYGFARLIFNRDQKMVNYIFAYVGAGLAVATKGGWGLLPVAFAFFFCHFRKRDAIRLRELIEVKSIAIAIFVALFWYVIAYYQHGDVFIRQFSSDQVGGHFSGPNWNIAKNMLTYVSAMAWEFMPWSFILMLFMISRRTKAMLTHFFREHKEACLFILTWYLSLCLIFSFGNILRTRFLFAAYPLVSALYAAMLVQIVSQGKGLSSSILQYIKWIMLATCFLFGLCLVLAGIFIDMRLIAGGILTIFSVAVLYATLFRRNNIYGLVMISVCIILIFSVAENFVSRVIYAPPASCVADKVRDYTQDPIEIAAIGMPLSHYQTQIYVLSGGSITVKELDDDSIAPEKMKQFQFIILSEPFKGKINLAGYSMEECGYTYEGRFDAHSLWSIRTVADLHKLLSQFKQHYYLLIKSQSSQHQGQS